jgi:large subunit ribosomal protein L28
MAKVCDITGKKTIAGNSVSHANNKTKRKFYPNLHKKKFFVEELGLWLNLKISSSALRSIDKYGVYNVLKKAKSEGTLVKDLCFLID